jgi:iron(III) transport system ATP-binding protein
MPAVSLEVSHLYKQFQTDQGEVHAVEDVSFEVMRGSFFTLLGPSGCGKSTTLRCIAGLEKPDAGVIKLEGAVFVSSEEGIWVPPHKRPMGMVFQSYAIWPHMDVFDNVAYPLKRGPASFSSQEIRDRVMASLELVQLDGLEKRPAPQLSGGQQQRLALARALVHEPQALLLDEPLSNLDAKLREQMRIELKQLTTRLNITTVFVTHDQLEALTLSDQIAVMENGEIVQEGSPREIYDSPRNRFAAEFIGLANFLDGTVVEAAEIGTTVPVETHEGLLHCTTAQGLAKGESVAIAIRPENVMVSRDAPAGDSSTNVLEGRVESVVFLGDALDCYVEVGNARLRADLHPSQELSPNDDVFVTFRVSAARVVPNPIAAVGARTGE